MDDRRSPGISVLAAGVATTVAALLGVTWLGRVADFQIMGWYWRFIPFGAISVGCVAGSGYAIRSRMTGARLGCSILLLIVALQTIAYLVIQYADFIVQRENNPGLADASFLQYFDTVTRSFSWEKDGRPGEALGGWGYFIRIMEVAGFSFGGLIGPLMLMSEPYCDTCRAYMHVRQVATFAGRPPTKKAADRKEDESITDQPLTHYINGLDAEVAAGNGHAFRSRLNEWKAAWPLKVTSGPIIRLDYQVCRRCGNGRILLLRVVTSANKTTTTTLANWPVDRDFLHDAAR